MKNIMEGYLVSAMIIFILVCLWLPILVCAYFDNGLGLLLIPLVSIPAIVSTSDFFWRIR